MQQAFSIDAMNCLDLVRWVLGGSDRACFGVGACLNRYGDVSTRTARLWRQANLVREHSVVSFVANDQANRAAASDFHLQIPRPTAAPVERFGTPVMACDLWGASPLYENEGPVE